VNYYYHHIGDFKKDTSFLTHEQRSIYLEMLWMYYDQEHGLDKDTKMLAIKVQSTIEQVKFLLSVYFDEQEDCYTHKRIEEELEKTYTKSETARKSAQARWDKQSMQTHSKCNANGILPNTQYPIPSTQNPIPKNHTTLSLEEQELCDKTFIDFWDIYPKNERKIRKKACEEKWKKKKLYKIADKIINHIRQMKNSDQWRRGFAPGPIVYINQERWLDEIEKEMTLAEKMMRAGK